GGAQAKLRVIVAVDHRVFRVVGDYPEPVENEQPPADRWNAVVDGRIRHRNAEREGDAEKPLREEEKTLEERIRDRDGSGGKRQQDGRAVRREHEGERATSKDRADGERFPARYFTDCERP